MPAYCMASYWASAISVPTQHRSPSIPAATEAFFLSIEMRPKTSVIGQSIIVSMSPIVAVSSVTEPVVDCACPICV